VSLAGWFIDDISVEVGALPEFEGFDDFESGFGNWSVEGGVWAIGEPTYGDGPDAASGSQVAGTMLGTYYLSNAEARLVSPRFVVPPAEELPRLDFSAWYDMEASPDRVRVQVNVDGAWQDVGGALTGSGRNWAPLSIDLSPFAGGSVQVGFLFESDIGVALAGMYIDDVELVSGS
jgi:bacillopeptidase F (M6 metalloprotease family)